MAGDTTDLKHEQLNGTFVGLDHKSYTQYRGIQYGHVHERFDPSQLLDDRQGQRVTCTQWGPRCPQAKLDLGYLVREPEGNIFYSDEEDEFKCVNLDVTIPKASSSSTKTKGLPVLFWIHGGSQIVSYGNGASKIGDVSKIVNDSVALDQPVIVVSVQYRLNIFHVGDGTSPERKNLGYKDLKVALEWVQKYIAGFGGDPNEITLAGESAGTALGHPLLITGANVKRAILMSGSMYMSWPRPPGLAKMAIIDPLLAKVKAKGYDRLKDAPVDVLMAAQDEVPVLNAWLTEDDEFTDWKSKVGGLQELMIGDCEYEGVIWRNGIETMTAEQITTCFDGAGASAEKLKSLYHISKHRSTVSKHGALDLIDDFLWARPVDLMSRLFRQHGRKVYRYVFDQANPWQASSRAHHGVDLIYLFGGFDISQNPRAEALGKEMRKRFICFVNGQSPWLEPKTFAFGPLGGCSEISEDELASRRRLAVTAELGKMPEGDILAVVGALIKGRISLHN